ncbi:MAG TPA: CHAT domain-containing protein, partial [Chitinophagaceae bacterium]|nr:CHAT domain-containing protein [Chitinophagaceae bacterium]
MPGKVILLLPAFLLLACCLCACPGKPPDMLTATYQKANQFFNSSNPTAATDRSALAGFEQVISQLEKVPDHRYDSLLFQSYLKKGILLDVRNENAQAKTAYLKAATIPRRNGILSDSLLFRPYIYAGTNFFNLNNFDSANYFLIKAEMLIKRFPKLPETERLYNTLGALHYVNGNYLQSKNYFNQALEFIKNRQPFDRVFALGLKSNIASSFYKMGLYAESLTIYNQIIKEKIPATYIYNGICMNMGKAYAAIKKYREALACFKKISAAETPGVLNEMALAHYELHQPDSANYYLDKLKSLKNNSKINILDIGINDLYRAGMQADQQHYMSALQSLQNSIAIFAGDFNNRDIYSNPGSFSGSYTYYRLFDALYKKAQTFELLNRSLSGEQYLTASLAAYKAALTLLGFIEKSYDTDDAKLFLKKKSQDVYSEALMVCLRLHRLHPSAGYLEQAFMISEKNKASVMAANLRQRDGVQLQGIDQTFLQTERNIKFAIARLDVKSEQLRNNAELKKLAKEKANYEIELSQLQKNLEQNNHYFQLKYEEDFHSAAELSKQLNGSQALFSFYTTKDALHVFAFTKTSFSYTRIDSLGSLQQETEEWINGLRMGADGRKFKAGTAGQRLYKHLIKPMQSLAPGKNEWIIIPDGKLYLLPFESLPDGNTGKTMLETTTISYQFSSRFMMNTAAGDKGDKKDKLPVTVLSFAPFINNGADYHQTGFDFINQLPASASEIAALTGTAFTGAQATKTMFLRQAGNYPIIHLATHAIADVQNPSASFIAFYPEKKMPAENCLYLEEIYGLNLDACKLVVISACETGKGELVNNEGIISLGRAFAYAGCGATINSLWKADDKATAAILKKFHAYLQRGYTKSKALQQAKLDYINSDAVYKSPAYWSNLILTGSIEPVYKSNSSF